MHKLLTGLATGAALTLFASTGLACDFHEMHTAATKAPEQPVVAMSTYSGTTPVAIEGEQPAASTCAPDAKDCAPANK
jgi:hypothetical protein